MLCCTAIAYEFLAFAIADRLYELNNVVQIFKCLTSK